jgi:2'-5' RNA ligase
MADETPAAVRAFLALDLDAPSVRRVARTADRLRMASGAPSARWTPPERMHVTLKFLAKLPVAAVDPFAAAVRVVVEAREAPPASSFRLGSLPWPARASVVVAALVDEAGGLKDLAARIEDVAGEIGLPREARRFRPHVTLARLKLPFDVRRWLPQGIGEGAGVCGGTSLTLFRSDLDASGSTYVPLARFGFAGA